MTPSACLVHNILALPGAHDYLAVIREFAFAFFCVCVCVHVCVPSEQWTMSFR